MDYILESICKVSKQRQDNYNDYYFYPQKDEIFKKEAFEDKIVIVKIFNANKQLIDEFNINVNTFWKSDTSTQIRTTTRNGQDISKKYNNSKIISFPKRYLNKFNIDNFFMGEDELTNNQIYSPGLTVEDWKKLFNDTEILKHNGIQVLELMYKNGGEASCKQLTILDGNTNDANYYKGQGQSLAMLIFNKTNCKKPELENGSIEWYSILFNTRKTRSNEIGSIVWQMRDEIKIAIKELNLFNNKEFNMNENIPLNQILYGPPGTGKTYNTVLKAMSIIDGVEYKDVTDKEYQKLKEEFDKYKQKGQIEFVTFHQSYSYEEFVEGIKPYIPEWGSVSNTNINYVGANGIFKQIANEALFSSLDILEQDSQTSFEFNNILERFKELYPVGTAIKTEKSCFAIIDYLDTSIRVSPLESKHNYSVSYEPLEEMFKIHLATPYSMPKDLADKFGSFKGLSTYYFNILEKLKEIHSEYSSKTSCIITEYTQEQKNLYIKKYHKKEIGIKNNVKPYILIIDEINRGDVSKIFGELITLIEKDKRIGTKYQMKTTLPYSKEQFGVPNNLYIIGTMNTADRSIALLDTALRRRFDFEEIMPRPKLLAGKIVAGINLEQLLKRINERITEKYDRDHQIGHSYLMDVALENDTDEISKNKLERAYKNRILPLLNEYFYNDEGSVAKILNDKDYLKNDVLTVLGNAQKQNEK